MAHESQKRNEMQKTQNKMTESHLKWLDNKWKVFPIPLLEDKGSRIK